MTELEELRIAYAECSRQRNELLAKLKQQTTAQPLSDERVSLIAHNIDDYDWNSLGFKESWHEGFVAGFRAAEDEHNIRMEK